MFVICGIFKLFSGCQKLHLDDNFTCLAGPDIYAICPMAPLNLPRRHFKFLFFFGTSCRNYAETQSSLKRKFKTLQWENSKLSWKIIEHSVTCMSLKFWRQNMEVPISNYRQTPHDPHNSPRETMGHSHAEWADR